MILALTLLTSAVSTQALAAEQPPLRIMELGDSITAGVVPGGEADARGGYRNSLAALMALHHDRVTFVGGRTGFSSGMSPPNHEGWPGFVIRSSPSAPAGQLYGALTAHAISKYEPDVILLMIGTNDLLRSEKRDPGYSLSEIAQNMRLLLLQIFAQKPSVRVIVAGIVSSPRISKRTVAAFDGRILPDIVAQLQKRGDRIGYVLQMQHAVPRDSAHFPDGLHPYGSGGYAMIANAWFDAFTSSQIEIAKAAAPPGAAVERRKP